MIIDAKPGKITFLGRLGEHLTRKIRFYDGDVLRDYPGAEISVLNQRPGDADSYPVPSAYIEQDGDYLYWTIQSGDLAAEGFGQCEMRATVDGKVALSVVYATEVGKSLAGGDEPPEPWEGYVGQVIDAADRAEAAAQLLENPGAEAVTLEPGAQATAGYEDGTFTFGIPAGAPGQDGEPGEDGYSPSVSVSKTGGTATITITDKSGTTTAEITDGQPGEPGDDGYSPSASVSKSGGTATITITDKNGTTTADVKDGADGQDGAPGQDGQDGYTPVRGTDYWTAADQAQILEDVKDALIDDTAGAGDVTKVWSASKSAGEVSSLKSAKAPSILQESSGDIVSFADGADGMPLASCVVSIDPVQSGSGDPSPSNVRPITGWTGANIYSGVNFFPPLSAETKNGVTLAIDADGNITLNTASGGATNDTYFDKEVSVAIPAGVSYYLYAFNPTAGASRLSIFLITDRGNPQLNLNTANATYTSTPMAMSTMSKVRFRVPSGAEYTNFKLSPYLQIGGSAPTAYKPFSLHAYPISWQTVAGTVYGGTLDTVTGVLTVTDANIASYAGETLPGAWISDRDVYTPGGTPTTGAQVVYKLATPQTVQLSAVEIKALLGENNLWADTGAISLTYPADTQTYVDSAITAATDPDGNVVQVSGSTPSITGESGKRYVCGTLDSLSITPPSVGIVDVVFTSGTTPTVLTVPNTVLFPGWFDPTSLDASTVYEINIQDGQFGAVMAWQT